MCIRDRLCNAALADAISVLPEQTREEIPVSYTHLWNDVLRQKTDIPSKKFIAETITLKELPVVQPVPMLRMADVELTSVEWLWFPYIPFGKLTIIQGNPGEGKTYFAMRLAAACTNRKPLPGMEVLEPFNIIYQTAEDGLGDTCLLYTSRCV